MTPDGEFYWIRVSFDPALAPYFIPKGSVAVDGISLTVAGLQERDFTVQLIPFTWDHTNLCAARVGDRVNLEVDVIGKYVVRVAQHFHGVAHALAVAVGGGNGDNIHAAYPADALVGR